MQRNSPGAAIDSLRARLDGGELNWVHVVLLRAYEQAGRAQDAREQADWISTHRGRAYVEWNSQYLLQPLNVLESNLALLKVAELARDAGDAKSAQAALRQLQSAWSAPPVPVAARMGAMQTWLSHRKSRTDQTATP